MGTPRRAYPSDVTEEEWAFAAPYLSLMKEDAPHREYSLREMFNALRWVLRTGAQWRLLPNDLPSWAAVNQQVQRWLKAGCFQGMAGGVLVGVALDAGAGWWWADPVASLIIVCYDARESWHVWSRERLCLKDGNRDRQARCNRHQRSVIKL